MASRDASGHVGTSHRVRRLVLGHARVLDLAVAVLLSGAVLVYAVTEQPWLDRTCYLGALALAAAAAWGAAESRPRGDRVAPRLVAVGLTLTAVGDVLWEVLDATGASTAVSIADPPWLASYLALIAAVWVVLTRSRPDRTIDVDFVVDALTVVAVCVLVFWYLSIDAIVTDRDVSPAVRLVWAAYPVADAVLLALVVRLLLSPRARSVLGGTFALGVVVWLAADVLYLRIPSGRGNLVTDAGWMVAPVLMARALWRWGPVSEPGPAARRPTSSMTPLVIAIAPLFVPPILEVQADLRGEPERPWVLLAGSMTLVVLAFVRTARRTRTEQAVMRALEEARDDALAASRAKSVFVATMSHEIRTPLTTVLATAEMLEESSLTEEQRALLGRMRRSGVVLHSLVEEILDFSRIESGHLRLDATTFDLHVLVEHLAEVYRPRADAAGLTFGAHLAPGLPRVVVGDAVRLQQVAGNLLDNALKFTDAGGLHLEVRSASPAPDAPRAGEPVHLEVVVTDTGIGIAPDRIGSVLDPFEQADGSSTRRHGGVGLGLAICQELVALMDGSLTVRSEPGVGSQFVASVVLRVAGGAPAEVRAPSVGGERSLSDAG